MRRFLISGQMLLRQGPVQGNRAAEVSRQLSLQELPAGGGCAGGGVDFGREDVVQIHAWATEALPDANEGMADVLLGVWDIADVRVAEANARHRHHDRQPRLPGEVPAEGRLLRRRKVAVGPKGQPGAPTASRLSLVFGRIPLVGVEGKSVGRTDHGFDFVVQRLQREWLVEDIRPRPLQLFLVLFLECL